jgi:hypothetical protein
MVCSINTALTRRIADVRILINFLFIFVTLILVLGCKGIVTGLQPGCKDDENDRLMLSFPSAFRAFSFDDERYGMRIETFR